MQARRSGGGRKRVDAERLIRPLVRVLHAYVPGEQPKVPGLIKLNTNENPYGPSPRVRSAIKSAVDGRLRLYPNPTAEGLRERLAEHHGCGRENITVGNGSDELLALATRGFVEPAVGKRRRSGSTIQWFTPSYSLYPVLAAIHGSWGNSRPLGEGFNLPAVKELKVSRSWDLGAGLTFVTTPNAPSGRGYGVAELEALCRVQSGVVVLDEAYVDFAEEDAMSLALKYPNVIVSRTFSKAYALCFLRVGYFVGHPALIAGLDKIRDSYNVNGLGQVAACATLDDLPWYRENFRRIIRTRRRVSEALEGDGFEVCPSQTNFVLVRPPVFAAQKWVERLREKRVLVRWFSAPGVRDYLRVTIGTDREMNVFLRAVKSILGGG